MANVIIPMHVIISNYGNDSVALIQWAYEQQLNAVSVLHVDTGWAAPGWEARVQAGAMWAEQLGFTAITLKPKVDFAELMRNRGNFPSRKFQWCAGFLKGLPLNAWLEQYDARAEAVLLIARRRGMSRTLANLPEFIEMSEHYGERKVWHPLYLHTSQQRDALVQRAGFAILPHRSLECDPCVNSDLPDLLRMEDAVLARAGALERELHGKLLDESLYGTAPDLPMARQQYHNRPVQNTNPHELFEMGCGSVFGCGL